MVVRRKYKKPPGYERGGAVPVEAGEPASVASADVTPPAEPVVLDIPQDEPEPVVTEPGLPGDDAVLRAVQATQRAEAYARDPVAATIASWSISDRRKIFLNQHRELLDPANAAAIKAARQEAASQGIAEDTEAEESAILSAVWADIQKRQEAAVENVRSKAPPILPPAAKVPPQIPTASGPPILPPRKASAPMTAPVTRNIPTASGQSAVELRSVTLSAEERAIARNSFGSIKGANGKMVDLTNEAKELLYAKNKARLMKMRAEGNYE
jgi:hypothetical protein